MLKVARFFTIAATAIAFEGVTAQPAARSAADFGVGYTDFGATLGLGGIGGAGFSIGARIERIFRLLPGMNNGALGIMFSADWYNYNERFGTAGYDFTYLPIGATANYHFNVTNTKVDPFVGLGLGYQIVSSSYSGVGASTSALYFAGRLGLRYKMSSKVSAYIDTGVGSSAFNVGATLSAAK